MTDFFYLLDRIFLLFSYENRKNNKNKNAAFAEFSVSLFNVFRVPAAVNNAPQHHLSTLA